MTHEEADYFRRREWQERAAAKNARSLASRRVHQEMAEYYGAMLRGWRHDGPVASLRACGAL